MNTAMLISENNKIVDISLVSWIRVISPMLQRAYVNLTYVSNQLTKCIKDVGKFDRGRVWF